MMDSFEEMRKVLLETNTVEANLADGIERQFGLEVGTPENLKSVKFMLLKAIRETEAALGLLTDDNHATPKHFLQFWLNYIRTALEEVEVKLNSL